MTPEAHYCQIYYEALDHVVEVIRNIFDQPGYTIYQNLEELLLKACKGEPYNVQLDCICSFYKDDLSKSQLEAQLPLLKPLSDTTGIGEITIHDVIRILGGLSSAERVAFSSVWTVAKLLLVMPATNATSERSFSSKDKTYLRTTMTQHRLNNLMLLHVNKEKTDALHLLQVGREFVAGREGRLRVFGDFKRLWLCGCCILNIQLVRETAPARAPVHATPRGATPSFTRLEPSQRAKAAPRKEVAPALHIQAAQHSLQQGCDISYSMPVNAGLRK